VTDGPGAVIVGATVAAGHDGRAEAVLELAYANGALSRVIVSQEAMAAAMRAAGVSRLEDLEGRPWTVLMSDRPGACS
jgi:hypothetical protein